MSLTYHELEGIVNKGILTIHKVPKVLFPVLSNKQYRGTLLQVVPDNTHIKITLQYNHTTKEITPLEDSLVIVGNKNNGGESIQGWHEVGGVWFSPEEYDVFKYAGAIASDPDEKAYNILLTGKSGWGKTVRAKGWAKGHDRPYARIDVSLLRHPSDMFGKTGLDEANATHFYMSQFSEQVTGNNAVVLLDEGNRATPSMLNAMFSLLDDERMQQYNTAAGNVEIKVGNNIIFVTTVNEGFQYTGTFEMDNAFKNRFGAFLEVDAPPLEVETRIVMDQCKLDRSTAESIVVTLDDIRGLKILENNVSLDITTRKAVHVGKLIKAGMGFKPAFKVSIINSADKELRKPIADRVNVLGV